MSDTNSSLPSLKALTIASLIATLIAGFVLIAFVLPAEYGIDPTGLGKKAGLTVLSGKTNYSIQARAIPLPTQKLSEITCSNQNAVTAGNTVNEPLRQDTVMITVPPNKGLEYKFHLTRGALLEYSWTTNGAKLYFDFHGEPKGDKSGYFKSYKESTDNQSSGDLTAPFEGSHGWYWENKTQNPATIILNTKGSYRIIGLI